MESDSTQDITASKVKKIVRWKGNSEYIISYCSKYVPEDTSQRGLKMEPLIRKLLRLNGYDFKKEGEIWIHNDILWLSCTTDGILYEGDGIVSALEIKSYESLNSLKNAFVINDNKYYLKRTFSEYYQIQMVAEILDVPFVVLVLEWQNKIRKLIIFRDLDFLWSLFKQLRDFYFRYLVPSIIYGKDLTMQVNAKKHIGLFTDRKYQEFLIILESNEKLFNNDYDEESMFCYYPFIKPSDAKPEYFEFKMNRIINTDILTKSLEYDEISILETH